MRSNKKSIKYFPFAPGIPWSVRGGKFVVPTLSVDVWHTALSNRHAVVACYGGLIESYASLMYCELLNKLAPEKRIFWAGDNQFNRLIWMNSLAKLSPENIPSEVLTQYPIPIFLDRKDFFYFNVLNNYLKVQSYTRASSYNDNRPILKQIFQNTTVSGWNDDFLPQIRNLTEPNEFTTWAKVNKFHITQPFVCLFPDRNFSIHDFSALDWSASQIRAFAAQLHSHGVKLLVFTKFPNKFHNSFAQTLLPKLDHIMYLLPRAKAILSEEIDYLLLGGLYSSAALVARAHKRQFNLKKNLLFFNKSPMIYTSKNITPTTALDYLVNGVS